MVVLIIAYLIFSGSGTTTYQLILPNAYQLVRGNTVQVGGVPVGSVTNIVLTKNFQARVTIQIKSSLAPLHHGTIAEVRTPSLSSVANRYVDLTPGPQSSPAYPTSAPLPVTVSKTVTDLDEVFNTFNPKTLKGLQGFLQGSAEQYAGAGLQLGRSTELFAPALFWPRTTSSNSSPSTSRCSPSSSRNRQGADDHRRPPRTALGPDRKRQHHLQSRRRPAGRNSGKA